MASRMSLTRLSAPLAKRALSTTAPASLSATAVASSSAAKLTGRNALLSTPVARVHRGESRFLVGQEQRRMASSEEGGSTMVCLACLCLLIGVTGWCQGCGDLEDRSMRAGCGTHCWGRCEE